MKTFEPEFVDLVITSPPYYGLRNYGVEGQLGNEKTPKEYISNLIQIFGECKRVLKKTGSMWVNIGDTYASSGRLGNEQSFTRKKGITTGLREQDYSPKSQLRKQMGKSLLGIPEYLVIAMTYDLGLIRRNTIIWHKSNCMPSSAKDRFTIDFEYFYFFSKSQKYWFETQYENRVDDRKRIKIKPGQQNYERWMNQEIHHGKRSEKYGEEIIIEMPSTNRIKRCVWKINTVPFPEAHFATFPQTLIETPIRACCPPNGIILDPFIGSGTVAVVAKKQRKNYVGIELNEEYIKLAKKRIKDVVVNETLI